MSWTTIVKSLPTQTVQVAYRPLQSFQIFMDNLPVDPTATYKKPTKILSRPYVADSEQQMSLPELCVTLIITMVLIFLLIRLLITLMTSATRRFPECLHQPWSYLQGVVKRFSSREILQRRRRAGKQTTEKEDGHGQELQANMKAKLFIKKLSTNENYTEACPVPRRRSG